MLPSTDLLQIWRLHDQQIAQGVQNSEQLFNNGALETLGAHPVLVDVPYHGHGAQLIVLEAKDVIVNASVELDAEFTQGGVNVATVQVGVQLGDLALDDAQSTGTGWCALVGDLVRLWFEVGSLLFCLKDEFDVVGDCDKGSFRGLDRDV